MKQLWVESYRPQTMDDYVWVDLEMRATVEHWLKDGALPHCLFSGVAGTGKTTLAKLLFRQLGIPDGDILYVNASRERQIDAFQARVVNFVDAWALGPSGIKYVLLDEADKMSQTAQGLLRNEMETYADVCRFVLTCVAEGTMVQTIHGLKPVEKIMAGDMIASGEGVFQPNRALRRTHSTKLYHLKTKHGFTISVTPTHRFKTVHGWEAASDLAVGRRITIALRDLLGSQYEARNTSSILNIDDFRNFLVSQHILDRATIAAAKEEACFLAPSSLAALKEQIDGLSESISIDDLCNIMRTTPTVARQTMARLVATGLVSRRRGNVSEYVYSADWNAVIAEIEGRFAALKSRYNLAENLTYSKFYYRYTRSHVAYSVEDILEQVKDVFTNQDALQDVLGRVAGFLFGDGSLSKKGLHFAGDNKPCLDELTHDLRVLNDGKDYAITQNGSDTNGLKIQFTHKGLALLFAYLGVPVGNKVEQEYELPWPCRKSTRFARSFIQALFDCDATTPHFSERLDRRSHRTVAPLVLRQHTCGSARFWCQLRDFMREAFAIESSMTVSEQFVREAVLGKPTQYERPRKVVSIQICAQEQILRYLECIGFFYEKEKRRADIMGYLRYKAGIGETNDFMSFEQWKEAYDFCDGMIQDKIIELSETTGDYAVYDCCFDQIHSYVTQGFVNHNCNYSQKIIPALHSRLQQLHFPSLDKDDYTMRVASVLDAEGVTFEPEILIDYIEQTFPDLRKCINLCQQRSTNGVLKPMPKSEGMSKDYLLSMLDLLRGKRYWEARKLLVQVQSDAWDEFYRSLYENLNLFGHRQEHRDEALLIIRNALVHHAVVSDPEINAAACLIELSRVGGD
jgi:replication factor C small subunit